MYDDGVATDTTCQHGMAAVGYRLTLAHEGNDTTAPNTYTEYTEVLAAETAPAASGKGASATTSLENPHPAQSNASLISRLAHRCRLELQSTTTQDSSTHIRHHSNRHSTRYHIGVLLNSVAGFLGFLHLLFGTVTFSGLLFIVSLDAISQVAMRLMASCMICRLVTMVEMTGLRREAARGEREKEMTGVMARTQSDAHTGIKTPFVRARVRC